MTPLPRLLYRALRFYWHKLGARGLYIECLRLKDIYRFHGNILFFRRYLEKNRERIRAEANSPPLVRTLDTAPGDDTIDFDRIKPVSGASVRRYEPGAFRIGSRVSKMKIGAPITPASWREAADTFNGSKNRDHDRCCLVVPRIVGQSFALHFFHLFTCFLHLRALQRKGFDVECLMLDSNRDRLSGLFTTCLPNCRFQEEFSGVRSFRHIVFVSQEQSWSTSWRKLLYTCGLGQDFHRFVLSAFDIPLPEPSRSAARITVIRRKQYTSAGGKPCIDRVLENEDKVISALQARYPDAEVQGVYFEELPLHRQLERFTQSDMLISMHGAGLIVGAYFLPPNAGLLELFPKYFRIPEAVLTCRAIAADRELHYERWLSFRRKNEFGTDITSGVRWSERYERTPVRHASLTRAPVAALLRRVDRLAAKIENRDATQGWLPR